MPLKLTKFGNPRAERDDLEVRGGEEIDLTPYDGQQLDASHCH
jgi:hypothetical protein